MAYPVNQPFPQNPHPALEIKSGPQAIRDYVTIFENRRGERPGGMFVDADIVEIMRMAEHLGKVSRFEIAYINKNLLRDREKYFRNAAQKTRLRILVHNHRLRNAASREDDVVEALLEIAPMPYFRDAEAGAFIQTAQDLSAKIKESRKYYAEHASDDPKLIAEVNALSTKLAGYVEGLTLTDIDKRSKETFEAGLRDWYNYGLVFAGGEPDHEAKWNAKKKKWENWNRDVEIFPADYQTPVNFDGVKKLIRRTQNERIRLVAGGHAFNTSSDTGGTQKTGVGLLITLDIASCLATMAVKSTSPRFRRKSPSSSLMRRRTFEGSSKMVIR